MSQDTSLCGRSTVAQAPVSGSPLYRRQDELMSARRYPARNVRAFAADPPIWSRVPGKADAPMTPGA